MSKLYIVVRADLTPGQQIAQACHGMREFTQDHPDIDKIWYERSNYVVVLSVEDEVVLQRLAEKACGQGIRTSTFREPDLSDSLTCVVLEPTDRSRKICRGLNLALRECKG